MKVRAKQALPYIEHWVVFFVLTLASQIALAGQQLDLSDATGRAAAVSAILQVIFVAARKAFAQSETTP